MRRPCHRKSVVHFLHALSRWWMLAVLLSLQLSMAQTASSAGADSPDGRGLRRTHLNVVASNRMLNNVNPNDIRAALRLWFETVGRQRGFLLDCRVDIIDNISSLKARLQEKSVDVIIPGIAEYLELESSHLMVPILTLALNSSGGAAYPYVLLVNPDSNLASIAGLRGKNILVSSRGGSNTALAWTDVLLNRERLGRASTFFGSIKEAAKAQTCILPLFFGTVDACVVDEVNLNLAKEMNPQLSRLKVLVRSRPMVESVIAMPVEPHPYHAELLDAILSLNEDVRHRQLLMVFKTDRILRLQASDLDPVRDLWKEYYRLPGASTVRMPPPVPVVESGLPDRGKGRN
ncbi:phosphate/phosphite/phosphonate ABC transporter substrate-binding protein [Paludibaculum fermentans]|uniref:PhnD/SsuA/transferrin family substrate-binding protein n=1 Tax=Paludibaculum fermentans TaxID=1473598 RepID=A0A7S7SN14_PALFE|nr:PhnD/SsuA/transferrin family substrate-binding protein [Paludibaculum fermentans]QOY89605.1 PhnD/SsuA/transferrin family substrate-binding protein [Paludibaculum fermentans]